ncbi:unnamed protein product [Boreogadus saida]
MKNSHRAAGNFQTAAWLTWGRFWWRVLAEQPSRRPKPSPVPLIQNTEKVGIGDEPGRKQDGPDHLIWGARAASQQWRDKSFTAVLCV